MMTTWPRRLLTTLALTGPVLLAACATGDDGDGTDTGGGRAEVAVSVLDDTGTGDGGAADGEAVGAAGGNTTADDPGRDGDEGTANAARGDGVAAEITGEPAEISTDPSNPDRSRGVLAVDAARTIDAYGDLGSGSGSTLVLIDYQLYWNPGGNFFDEAVRLIVDGTTYNPAHTINELGDIGQVLNGVMVFEVPAGVTDARLEAGLPEGTAGGSTATFDLHFDPALPVEEPATGEVAPAEGTVEGEPAPAALNTDYFGGRATVSVEATAVTDRSGEIFAGEGTKLITAEVTLTAEEDGRGNVMDQAFRLRADDEWYSCSATVNEIIELGQTLTVGLVFEVPLDTSSYHLEVGAPAAWSAAFEDYVYEYDDQPTATFDLVF